MKEAEDVAAEDRFSRVDGLEEGLGDVEAEAAVKTTLSPFHPFSPQSIGSGDAARLKVRLARLQMEAQDRAESRQAEMNFRLQVRKFEIEADKQVKLRQLELESTKSHSESRTAPANPSVPVGNDGSTISFDISKHIVLVPQFRENEVDSYFNAFERIASSLRWPKEAWTLLLQCRLVGKAQEVFSTLSLDDSMKYDIVKNTILRAYELVPEAYRQRFRNHRKTGQQTYVEFAREKGILFDKWLAASKVPDFNSLKDLMMLEEFKNCVPERVVTYLNEQKVVSSSQAAILADEFVLTHKNVFSSVRSEKNAGSFSGQSSNFRVKQSSPPTQEVRECFYCHKRGHVISDCMTLKRKQTPGQPKSVRLVKMNARLSNATDGDEIDIKFMPFLMKGFISLNGDPDSQQEVNILRDTGAALSFVSL